MKAELERIDAHSVIFRMSGMDEPSKVIDYRIAGWAERAFEVCRANGVKIQVAKSAAAAGDRSEIHVSWQ